MTTPTRKHREDRVAGADWLAWAYAAALTLVSLSVGASIELKKETGEPIRQLPTSRPVALVVGNTDYEHSTAGLGCEVVKGVDLDRAESVIRVANFGERSRGRMASLFYYAGYAHRGSRCAKGDAFDVLFPVDVPARLDVGKASPSTGASNSVDVEDGRIAVRIIAESEDHVEPLKRLIETAAHGSVQATFENNIYASLPVEVIATFARVEAVYRIDLGEAVVAPPEQDSVPVPAGEGPAASQAIPEHVREWWLQIKDTAQPNHLEAFIEANPEDRNAHLARVRLKELWATAPAGTVIRDFLGSGGRGPEMVVIPAGRFRMGCLSNDDACYGDEMPVHDVTIPVPFALSAHEVTFEDYDRFTHPNEADDAGWGRGARPVINVSWDEAKDYVEWLSSETGATYRLPSEAEWEYAARAGSATKYHFGSDSSRLCRWGNGADLTAKEEYSDWTVANCRDGHIRTAPTGSFEANGFGLHDMHGNVWEWVEDCWNGSYAGAPSDGVAWVSGDCAKRVLRGGSWNLNPRFLRAAYRLRSTTGIRLNDFGFRVSRTLTP